MESTVVKREREFTWKDLSGMMIMLIVAGSFLLALCLFIFAKRQIMRYAIRNRYSPHYPTGQDAKKSVKREIERRLDSIQKIYYEPQLIEESKYILKPGTTFPPYYYRQRAVDDVKLLVSEIPVMRGQRESLRAFLLSNLSSIQQNGSGQRMIHQFCDMYEHARFDPNEFGDEEYQAYHRLLLKMIDAAKVTKTLNSSKSSPSRTPIKKQKLQSLLDPSRLRPPPPHRPGSGIDIQERKGSNSRKNLSLGAAMQGQEDQDENEILSISHIHGEIGPKLEML